MRIVIRPSGGAAPQRELDVTRAIVAAVAQELWKAGGGNDVLNWLEAERQVARLLASSDNGRPGRSAGAKEPKRGGGIQRRTTTLHPPLEHDSETLMRS